LYNKQIDQNKKQIADLEASLESLKDDYAKMIRFAQKNSSAEDRLMYIFASQDFYQATSRIKYLQQIARYRENQAKEIVATQSDLDQLNLKLLSVINEKDALLKNEEQTRKDLSQDVVAQKTAVEGLQQEEKGLLQKLREQEKQREKLNKEIQRIIEAEIRASKKDNAGVFSLTPEAAALSASFESNKGKLPWPVERGVITAKFGQNPHPVLAGIMVPNNGVDIATSNNAAVRAVFQGTVSGVFSIPGAGQNVIINHGGYRTVYSNLKEVFVSKGQKVEIKQSIGTVLTDESSGKTEAHLEIWKVSESGTTKQDPALWIYRQ
jgi:murein DD-endopeptidase MepM/ murein hydrolase activator NlpD